MSELMWDLINEDHVRRNRAAKEKARLEAEEAQRVLEEIDDATGLPQALIDDVEAIAKQHDNLMYSGPLPPTDRGGWTSAEADAHDRGRVLYDIVTKWRDENGVWNGEVIALYDNVRETFDDLIFDLINTVGYAPEPPEDD
jgi:hypothetical protein